MFHNNPNGLALRPGLRFAVSLGLGVAVMFDEASAIELVTEVLVKGVCVRSMVAAGHLDTATSVRPGKLLGCRNEQSTDATVATVGRDDETRDTPKESVGVKERDAM